MTATRITETTAAVQSAFSKAKTKGEENKEHPWNHVDHPGGPSLSLLWSKEPLVGQTLYLGGETGCDGKIYCIPGHAPRVLVIDPETDEVYPVGPVLKGKYKWLRGVQCGDVIYGLPCHADTVLRIHVPTLTISKLSIPYSDFYADPVEAKEQRSMEWKYHGGSASPIDGCIYTVPQSAWHVLKIDPRTDSCEFVDSPPLKGRYKWYGGVVGKQDGAIYGIPHNSPSVLRIDPLQEGNVVTLHGDYGQGGHKWHGASAAPDGTIVSVPANADTVLCVTPARPEPILKELGNADVIQTGRHRSDGKYKFLGAMTGTDGRVYCFPCASEKVLQVDTVTNQVRAVGPNLYDTQMERMYQNKWQNGLTSVSEQCIYAIPLSAETVLRIDTSSDEPIVTTWKLPSPYGGLAKWEGATLANNGVMYTCPNNHKAVLRISVFPGPTRKSEAVSTSKRTELTEESASANKFRYTTGIATLRSSAHRVKHPPKQRKHDPKPKDHVGKETNKTFLSSDICAETIFRYDVKTYDFSGAVASLLRGCDPAMVGEFPANGSLEDFVVPELSLSRSDYGGQCERAQVAFSNAVAVNEDFLSLFDRFVVEVVLPHFKARLLATDDIESDSIQGIKFYYQRPPTIRLQPGPARAEVKTHNDSEYGHQNGELNFWLPLTDRDLTGVDLWCESSNNKGDYHPLPVNYGEVVSFHGSSCRHYVNANHSNKTRMSLDFRVGVEGFYDPQWQMVGTTNDHDRQVVRL